MRKNILITCGGGMQGETLLKELNELDDVCVHVCDIYEQNITRYLTPFYTVSPKVSDKEKYERFLIDYIDENEIDYVIPATIYDLTLLSKLKNKIVAHVAVSEESALDIFMNKRKTYEWLTSLQIPTFEIIPANSLKYFLPVIGKEENEWGGKGIRIIENTAALEKVSEEDLNRLTWTTYLSDYEEFSVDFAVSVKGEISAPTVRKRERILGGFSIIMKLAKCEEDEELFSVIQKLLIQIQCAGGVGLFNAQILKSNNKFYVSDINPRVGTSAVMGRYNGNNLCGHLLNSSSKKEARKDEELRVIRTTEERVIKTIPLSNIKCIVFDLDDTLINHKDWIYSKLCQTANCFKTQIENVKEFLDYGMLLLDEGKAFMLFDELCRYFNLDHLKAEMINCYRAYLPASISIYKDVPDTLNYLSKKYKLAILTDNPIKSQKQKISVFPFTNYFENIVYTRELGCEKPHIKVFQKTCEKLEVSAQNLVMVGDNFHRDIKGAINGNFSHAFQIIRENCLFNTRDLTNKDEIVNKVTILNNLKELAWYL